MTSFKQDLNLLYIHARTLSWTRQWDKLRELQSETRFDIETRFTETGRTIVEDTLYEVELTKDNQDYQVEPAMDDALDIVSTLVLNFDAKLTLASLAIASRLGIDTELANLLATDKKKKKTTPSPSIPPPPLYARIYSAFARHKIPLGIGILLGAALVILPQARRHHLIKT